MGSDNANFGFAAKKTLANGADFHIKSDLTGQVELAHVSVSIPPTYWIGVTYDEITWILENFRRRIRRCQVHFGSSSRCIELGQEHSCIWSWFRVQFLIYLPVLLINKFKIKNFCDFSLLARLVFPEMIVVYSECWRADWTWHSKWLIWHNQFGLCQFLFHLIVRTRIQRRNVE